MMKLVYSAAENKGRDLDEEALAWIVRLTSGQATPEDGHAFRSWRDQSAEHLAALDRARTLWGQLGVAIPEAERHRRWPARLAARSRRILPIAAALLLSLSAGERYWTNWRFDQVTASGERRVVTLADGSRVTMGGDTAFNVDTRGSSRRIVLARGEALFDVRHDAARPFVVHVQDAEFRDVGTVFDLKHAGDLTQLTVTQGLVEASSDDRRLLIGANQAVTVAGGAAGPVHAADAALETSWTKGRMVFHDQSLSEIVAALVPYYRGRIVVLDHEVGSHRLSATVDLDHVDDWLSALGQIGAAKVTQFGGLTLLT